MNLFVKIGVILIGAIIMAIVIYVFEKATKEAIQEIDAYYEDIHNFFYED